jgi:hypothetical protein
LVHPCIQPESPPERECDGLPIPVDVFLTGRRLAILAVPVSLPAALAAQADGEVLPGEFVLHGPDAHR